MHINIQGIKEKCDVLNVLLENMKGLKIVCINEHNIKDSYKNRLNKIDN